MANLLITIRNIVQGGKDVKGLGDSLTELKSSIDLAKEAAGAAGEVFQKAWNLSKEGAQLNDLTMSFERMNAEVFKVPGLLDKMTAATNNTISRADAMKGILTLSAGASNSAAQAYAEAAPRLLEIAKASNKLNPALGDTSFLFDSLALGIKRGSPMILDNLGLQIKLGAANEEYAKSLGKSVEALTAEEKTMALLNATLTAGDQLINQVGGSVDAQADSWAQLEVRATDAGNAMKQAFADRLIGVISGAANTVDTLNNSTNENRSSTLKAVIVLDELAKVVGVNDRATQAWIESQKAEQQILANTIEEAASYDRALMNIQGAYVNTIRYSNDLANSYAATASATRDVSAAQAEAAARLEHMKSITEGFKAAASPIQDLLQAQQELADSQGEWVQVTRTSAGDIAKINEELAGDLSKDQKEAMEEILKNNAEGSAEWLAAYNALQADLSDSARMGLIAQRAELAGQGDTLASVYTGDMAAAKEAQAAIAAAEEAIRAEYRATAAEAILARGGVTQANLDLLVGIGYLSQAEADMRMEFATTTTAIEELTASQEFQKLTTEQQTAALNSLIAGQTGSADAALRAGQEIQKEGESVEELRNRLVATSGTYTATVNADTSAAEAAVRRLQGLINSVSSGATQVTSAVGSELAANAAAASAGNRASGGDVMGGQMYRVGEGNMPELFMIPGDRGRVMNQSDIRGMGGGGNNISITIHQRPGEDGGRMANRVANMVADKLGGLN